MRSTAGRTASASASLAPVTPVTDIKIVEQDLVLSTMGRGFWILDDLTPLYEVSDEVAAADAHLFRIRDAYRRPRVGFGDGPAAPQYPPVGAYVDYYLRDEGDELLAGVQTTTRVWAVSDLRNHVMTEVFANETTSIDHNVYTQGRYAYASNYTTGLRVYDTRGLAAGEGLEERRG